MKLTDSERRRDRFDRVVTEYLRSNKQTTEYLSEKIGCSLTSLWRYRYSIQGFQKMPLDIFAGICRMSNISNDDLRYILGIPTGKADEN